MLGEIGIMAIASYGLYFGVKRIKSKEYKVQCYWNKALNNYPHQTSIRNTKGNTFRLIDVKINNDNITGRLRIPPGLDMTTFEKLIGALENSFYGKVEITSNHYINIISGRREFKC